jgi:hypothetical protein
VGGGGGVVVAVAGVGAGAVLKPLSVPYLSSMYCFWQEQAWAVADASDSANAAAAAATITRM